MGWSLLLFILPPTDIPVRKTRPWKALLVLRTLLQMISPIILLVPLPLDSKVRLAQGTVYPL